MSDDSRKHFAPNLVVDTLPAATALPNPHTMTSAFEELPFDAIECICLAVHRVCRVTLLHLALASPVLYAPAIHTALREPSNDMQWLIDRETSFVTSSTHSQQDIVDRRRKQTPAVPCNPGDAIAAMRHADSPEVQKSDLECCYLVLPSRSKDSSWTSVNFLTCLKQDVLRIPLAQVRHFVLSRLSKQDVIVTFPPFLESLTIDHSWIQEEQWRTLPLTLQSLRIVTLGSAYFNLRVLARHFPSALSRLELVIDHLDDQTLANYFDQLPQTLESLSVWAGQKARKLIPESENKNAIALVERLRMLPRLTMLEHHAWHLRHFNALVLALSSRRLEYDVTPLRSLTLGLLQPVELVDLAALLRIESRQTLHVDSVNVQFHEWDCFDVDMDILDQLVMTVIPMLPIGTRIMRVGLPTWEPSWADALGHALHLDLCHLTMETNGGADGPQTFPFDSMHLPSALRTLSLHACAYSFGSVTFSSIPQALCVPATLEQLDLSRNYFSTADLAGLFPHGWPPQLQVLRLDNNFLNRLPHQLPPKLRELSLKACAQACEDDDQEAWAASLPLSLRVLDVSECGLDDRIAEGLVKWAHKLPRRHARRVHVCAEDCSFESSTIVKQLREVVGKFDVGYWFE